MTIGDLHYRNVPISIGPLREIPADMLLDAGWLRANRVWLSYAAHKITIQPVRPDM